MSAEPEEDPLATYLASLAVEDGRVALVPTSYRGTLALAPEALDFVKFCRRTGAEIALPEDVAGRPSAELRGDIWFLPALLVVAHSEIVRDASLGVALNLIASYIWDRLKRAIPGSKPEARVRIFHKRGRDILEFEYTGPADVLAQLRPWDITAGMRPLKSEADDADVESIVETKSRALPAALDQPSNASESGSSNPVLPKPERRKSRKKPKRA